MLAIGIFTLGIGANTALFSVINSVLLRRLPFPEPDRLMMLWETDPKHLVELGQVAPTNFFDWQKHSRSFESMGAASNSGMNLTGNGEAVQVRCQRATAGVLPTLGVQPQLGRFFTAREDWPEKARVTLISHALWMERFAGDPHILGRSLTLDGQKYTVIGVMPAGFVFLNKQIACWVPIGLDPAAYWKEGRYLEVVARLKPGISQLSAQAELQTLAAAMAKASPDLQAGYSVVSQPLREQFVRKARLPLLALAGAIACVLLIACANIGGLLLARGAARARDTAVRISLGASSGRLAMQHLTEAVLLTGTGGILGLVAAKSGTAALVKAVPEAMDITSMGPVTFDWKVLLFAAAAILSTGLICGVAPALAASRQDPQQMLRGGGNSAARQRGIQLRRLFVIFQTAAALVLLSGAGLLMRSVLNLYEAPIGFDPQNLLTFQVDLPNSAYPSDGDKRRFFSQALDRLQGLPGVKSAALVDDVPLGGLGVGTYFYLGGHPDAAPGTQPIAQMRAISPGYFRTLSIPLRAGRDFTSRDTAGAPRAYIINELLAREYFPNENPLGRQLSIMWAAREPGVVVGVVGNVRYTGITNEVMPAIYWPEWQHTFSGMNFLLKTSVPPLSVAPEAAKRIRQIDPQLPLNHVQPFTAIRDKETAEARFLTMLLSFLAGLAVVLAASGLFGLLGYMVTQQRREIGVRMALGAVPRQVLAGVMREGAALIAVGLISGAVLAWWVGARYSRPALWRRRDGLGDAFGRCLVAAHCFAISSGDTGTPGSSGGTGDRIAGRVNHRANYNRLLLTSSSTLWLASKDSHLPDSAGI